MSSLPEIQNRIQQTAGIRVSLEWLQACISYLNQQQQNNGSSLVDRCLHQLLYTDIRDLVDNAATAATASITNLQGLITRSMSSPPAIITNGQQQRSATTTTTIQTPNDFRLLVQLEEAVDVSLSREQRFNPQHFRGNTTEQNNNNNNNRNRNNLPRLRCLKLCLCSGHIPLLLEAQEVTPIPNLQPDSPAGMKILLHGSVVVKHGYLQLHSGNATVLGGQVTALVQLQQAALEKARKEMGVGVDPTVRALVGVEDLLALEDEEDEEEEGNEQSGDVEMPTAATINPTAQHMTTTSFTAPAPMTATTNATHSFSTTTTTNGRPSATAGPFSNNGSTTNNGNGYSRSHPPSAPPAPAPAPIIIQAPNNPYRNIGPFGAAATTTTRTTSNNNTPNPQAGNPPQPQTSSTDSTRNTNPYSRQRQGTTPRVSISPRPNPPPPPNNPYAAKNTNTNTSNRTTSINSSISANTTSPFPTTREDNLARTTTTTTTTPASNSRTAITPASSISSSRRSSSNPYLKKSNTNNNHTTANQGQSAVATGAGFRTASSLVSGAAGIPTRPPSRPTTLPLSSSPPSDVTATNHNAMTNNASSSTTTSNVQNLTFANLYKLLEQAIQNRQLYSSYYDTKVTFRVAMLQKTDNILFNVGKNKEYKTNKAAEKYEFITHTLFGTTGDAKLQLLACKLPSSLVESCFEISATELRGLSKSDRAKCDRMAKQGGDNIRAKFFPNYLQYWKARLHPTAEEVFGNNDSNSSNSSFALDNVATPILILEPDKT